ncbi:MAG: hypothetical protein HQK91_13825 [Nitrospirae bacterium]|nr:hypothetical protein [Nitrospirota bacterium]
MNILGISGSSMSPAACLMIDGQLKSCVEEERFVREKVARGRLPINAIRYCLNSQGLKMGDIDDIALAWDCAKYPEYMGEFLRSQEDIYPKKGILYRENEAQILKRYTPSIYLSNLNKALNAANLETIKELTYFDHHKSHAASSYYNSGFDRSLIFIMDGSGEDRATTIWLGEGERLTEIREFKLPHSLGRAYSSITEFLGFRAYTDEGKVMGLAPYGRFDGKIDQALRRLIIIKDNGDYEINPDLMYYGNHTYNERFTDELAGLLGEPRRVIHKNEPIKEHYKNIAWSVQNLLEEVVSGLVRRYIKESGVRNVCVGGGVAMNCKMNGVISKMSEVDGFFVHPASHDGGVCIGSAILSQKRLTPSINIKKTTHSYYGSSYEIDQIKDVLKYAKLTYKEESNPAPIIAQYLKEGKVAALFQGRMEIGPRALGNRSILASPLLSDTKQLLNNHVKGREDWRPFCPSILEEYGEQYFEALKNPWYMAVAVKVKGDKAGLIPSAVHVDGTARPQFVRRVDNPLFWEIINEFYKITGVPVIINTSFNIMGEPIINTPQEAVRCFYSTGIDILLMERFILMK